MNGWLKKALIGVLVAPSVAFAGTSIESARVVDVDPIYESVQVSVPREQCYVQHVPRRRKASATGPILGAIIGGAVGNAVGHNKTNKRVGTVVGALLGGSIGYDISRRNADRDIRGSHVSYRAHEVCEIVDEYTSEERLLGYHVTYRYAGETYTTRMDHHPGDSIRVRVHVSPVG